MFFCFLFRMQIINCWTSTFLMMRFFFKYSRDLKRCKRPNQKWIGMKKVGLTPKTQDWIWNGTFFSIFIFIIIEPNANNHDERIIHSLKTPTIESTQSTEERKFVVQLSFSTMILITYYYPFLIERCEFNLTVTWKAKPAESSIGNASTRFLSSFISIHLRSCEWIKRK